MIYTRVQGAVHAAVVGGGFSASGAGAFRGASLRLELPARR